MGYLLFKFREKLHDIVFGFGFFIISIALVLQILPVGGAIIAERYTYIPYIGLFFIVGVFINNIYEDALPKLKQYKMVLLGLFAIIILMYSYQANERTKVWKDSITLWSEVEQNYDSIPSWISTNLRISYRDKAKELLLSGDYKSAEAHYTNYIIRRADNPLMYYERGLCYFNLKMYSNAIADYNSAIALKGDYFAAYYNKGITYNDLGDFKAAITAYSNALKYNNTYVDAYYNRAGAYFMTQQLPLALQDVLKAKDLGYNVDPRFIEAINAGIK
jgi:tetratricopeptide (TPR) repeat protein